MEEDKRLEKVLLEKGIKEYKIVRCQQTELQFVEYFNEKSVNISEEDKLNVWFKNEKYTCKFILSAGQSEEIISNLIESSKESYCYPNIEWNYINSSINKSNDYKRIEKFENFDIYKNINWITSAITKIRNQVDFSFNTSYIAKFSKYELRTNMLYDVQADVNSEILCVENCTFEKKARLQNVFCYDTIENVIISKMNSKKQTIKNNNIYIKNKKVVLKAKAMAQLLNKYIMVFYANNVYFDQSYISIQDIGKKIISRHVDLTAVPFKNMRFDGEGTMIEENTILKNGVLKNLLGNNKFTYYMNIRNFGNADLYKPSQIKHQRIKFKIEKKQKREIENPDFVICYFDNMYFDILKKELVAIAVCKNKRGSFKTDFQVNMNDIMNNIYQISEKRIWVDNVFCSDMIMKYNN